MTEQEWLECDVPRKMLRFLGCKASDRKLRLFAVACCRRIWPLLVDERSKRAVEVAEQLADGLATEMDRKAASADAGAAITWDNAYAAQAALRAIDVYNTVTDADRNASATAANAEDALDDNCVNAPARETLHATEQVWQIEILRDLFGNPFRPITINPSWLTPTVLSLAQTVYDDQAFDQLPILADALEEAGCDNADILTHCRLPGEHVKGCWVVDLVLGKK